MKPCRRFFFSLLLATLLSVSKGYTQSPVYAPFEVDSVASPRGGQSTLETFLLANLQKPFMAKLVNATGKVIVKATVEADGVLTDVQLVRGLRPDCDQEAMRVMRLFNAWRPALKAGVPVRQTITYAVPFYANLPIDAKPRLEGGFWVTQYLDWQGNVLSGLDAANLPAERLVIITTPVDAFGHTIGDAKVVNRGPLGSKTHSIYYFRFHELPSTSQTVRAFQSALTTPTCSMHGEVLTRTQNGRIRSSAWYNRYQLYEQRTFFDNGLVEELRERQGELIRVATWYPNGQLKQVSYFNAQPKTDYDETLVTDYWDSTGVQTIRDGVGLLRWVETVASLKDTSVSTYFIQQAGYKQGLKNGLGTGSFVDGSYRYTETYDSGICRGGFSVNATGDTVRYTTPYQAPVFRDGLAAQELFFKTELMYPLKLKRTGIRGSTWVKFLISPTGALSNYSFSHTLHPDLEAEVVRVLDASKGRWQPAMVRGEPIATTHQLLFMFQLDLLPGIRF
ncbi:energy transducer TonB [Fibrella arboris]|uniref:energy transducer TonB n=1 Tax=Fibrella arboris TaxID=3242486 RepID=UPI003521EAB7